MFLTLLKIVLFLLTGVVGWVLANPGQLPTDIYGYIPLWPVLCLLTAVTISVSPLFSLHIFCILLLSLLTAFTSLPGEQNIWAIQKLLSNTSKSSCLSTLTHTICQWCFHFWGINPINHQTDQWYMIYLHSWINCILLCTWQRSYVVFMYI